MLRDIVVRDVLERNNCAGRKLISIIGDTGEDEIIKAQFRLTPAYMTPYDKLLLACVRPDDKVQVLYNNEWWNLPLSGDYVSNISNFSGRSAYCGCGQKMESDGFHLFCLNPNCYMTFKARLENLANIYFYDTIEEYWDPDWNSYRQTIITGGDGSYRKLFKNTIDGSFWGSPNNNLDFIFNQISRGSHPIIKELPNLATFMVESLFEEFSCKIPIYYTKNFESSGIYRFFGYMEEITNRRDSSCPRQNFFLKAFVKSLGIESLTDHLINQIILHTTHFDSIGDTMLNLAFILNKPSYLVSEFSLHPLEAYTIVSEIKRRIFELHDIFYEYSHNRDDITELFFEGTNKFFKV